MLYIKKSDMTHEKRINALYMRELGGALMFYAAVLYGALTFGPAMPDGALKTAVMLTPMLPVLLAAWAIARHLARVDEYARKMVLECIAIAFAVTAGVTFTYGFLENVGFPRLSMFVIWPLMGGTCVAVSIARGLCSR
jgi:hypothetical protein